MTKPPPDSEEEFTSVDPPSERPALQGFLLALLEQEIKKRGEGWKAELFMSGLLYFAPKPPPKPHLYSRRKGAERGEEKDGALKGDQNKTSQAPAKELYFKDAILPLFFEPDPPSEKGTPAKDDTVAEEDKPAGTDKTAEDDKPFPDFSASDLARLAACEAWKQRPEGVNDDQWATLFALAYLRVKHEHNLPLFDWTTPAWEWLGQTWRSPLPMGKCLMQAEKALQAGCPQTPLIQCGVKFGELLKLAENVRLDLISAELARAGKEEASEDDHRHATAEAENVYSQLSTQEVVLKYVAPRTKQRAERDSQESGKIVCFSGCFVDSLPLENTGKPKFFVVRSCSKTLLVMDSHADVMRESACLYQLWTVLSVPKPEAAKGPALDAVPGLDDRLQESPEEKEEEEEDCNDYDANDPLETTSRDLRLRVEIMRHGMMQHACEGSDADTTSLRRDVESSCDGLEEMDDVVCKAASFLADTPTGSSTPTPHRSTVQSSVLCPSAVVEGLQAQTSERLV
eukprot:gene8019-1249_t